MDMKNITRYDGSNTPRKGFNGWRLCLTRRKEVFVRYFTDREYGGEEAALQAAVTMRAEMLEALAAPNAKPSALFARYRKKKAGDRRRTAKKKA